LSLERLLEKPTSSLIVARAATPLALAGIGFSFFAENH
jgi:hypothetical protein